MALTNEQKQKVEDNIKLVYYVVNRYTKDIQKREDLYSIGTFGLIKAVENYDSSRGATFATYANRMILNELNMQYRKDKRKRIGETVELDEFNTPTTELDTTNLLWEDIRKLLTPKEFEVIQLVGQHYTQDEIAQKMGISRSYVSRISMLAKRKIKKGGIY